MFWLDEQREFDSAVGGIEVPDVKLIRMDQLPSLELKILLERGDTTGRYLLYMPFAEPSIADDWLRDIRLYSGSFRADRASLYLAELGLSESQSLRSHIGFRSKFLFSRDRALRLKKLVVPSDNEEIIDLKMLAVVTKAERADLFLILQSLFQELGEVGFDEAPAAWSEIVRFDLEDLFWRFVKLAFGYAEEFPKLRTLLIRLLATDFTERFKGTVPASLSPLRLPHPLAPNSLVFLNQWRDSATMGGAYDKIAQDVEKEPGC